MTTPESDFAHFFRTTYDALSDIASSDAQPMSIRRRALRAVRALTEFDLAWRRELLKAAEAKLGGGSGAG